MISRFQAGVKKRSICSGVAWFISVGRNIPKWRSKGSGLSGCTQLDHAAGVNGKQKYMVTCKQQRRRHMGKCVMMDEVRMVYGDIVFIHGGGKEAAMLRLTLAHA